MPVHPSEEDIPPTQGNITDAVAQNPSSATDSTASAHASHTGEGAGAGAGAGAGTEGVKARAEDFINKGPQIPLSKDDLPPKASREEMEQRMKELNQ